MIKSELRKQYLENRQAFLHDEVSRLSEKIFENFLSYFKPVKGQKVHCFLSVSSKREVDTQFFLKYFFENEIEVFVPKIFQRKLISVKITKTTELIENYWGILEPKSNTDSGEKAYDFILTPMLYCDKFGNRVGFGKGFYDKFFSEINEDCKKIGLNFFEPAENVDDVSKTDISMNYLVTPTDVLSFSGLSSKFTK